MNITVSFNAGDSIRDACTEAKAFAENFGFQFVEFQFNEISCSITKDCDVDKACEVYFKATRPESKYKFVIA